MHTKIFTHFNVMVVIILCVLSSCYGVTVGRIDTVHSVDIGKYVTSWEAGLAYGGALANAQLW